MKRSVLAFLLTLGAVACSSGATSSDPDQAASSVRSSKGGMELRVVDAPSDEAKEIVVTINRIDVHASSSGWTTLSTVRKTVDLLKLQNGVFESFGITTLPSGKITQFRLYVDETGPNYVTTPDGKQVPLKVPSGEQSGIKLKAGFDMPECATGQITFDFDGKKSIFAHSTGREDQWILRPVIRLKAVSFKPQCDAADGGSTAGDAGTGTTAGSTTGTTAGSTTGTTAGSTTGTTAGSTTGTTSGTTSGSTTGTTSGDGAGTTTGDTSGTTSGTTSGDSPSGGSGTVDPSDPCAAVSCDATGQYCLNGMCVDPIY